MECWGKARERVVKATFVGAGKEGLCPQMQNPRLRRGIFIYAPVLRLLRLRALNEPLQRI